jgi:hypothetical protein
MDYYTQQQMQQQQQMQLAPGAGSSYKQQQAPAGHTPKPSKAAAAAANKMGQRLVEAALLSGQLKKRDDKGRFYRKEHLQVWARLPRGACSDSRSSNSSWGSTGCSVGWWHS